MNALPGSEKSVVNAVVLLAAAYLKKASCEVIFHNRTVPPQADNCWLLEVLVTLRAVGAAQGVMPCCAKDGELKTRKAANSIRFIGRLVVLPWPFSAHAGHQAVLISYHVRARQRCDRAFQLGHLNRFACEP